MSAPQGAPRRGAPVDVLFVGHEASRTGAPLMFLYFLRWLREHTDLRFEIVLVEGGPLVDDFAAVAPTVVLADLREHPLSRALVAARLDRQAALVRGALARRRLAHLRSVGTVYCNSVVSLRMVHLLGAAPRLVIAHVHELMGALGMPRSDADRRLLTETANWVVAASDLVRDYLVDEHGLDPTRVVRHYEFIEVDAFLAKVPKTSTDLRAELGIPAGAAVVGAVGVTESRKGPDLFLSLAQSFRERDLGRPVHFVWVGAQPDTEETRWMRHDLDKAGLSDIVHVVGPQAVPAPWFQLFDVFTLTSREDPFPLVCLESSLLGTPIVCFDNTGMAEFAGDGECGFVVPYLDLKAMGDRVVALLEDDELRRSVGERAAAAVRDRFDVGAGAPALYADLERWRSGAGRDG